MSVDSTMLGWPSVPAARASVHDFFEDGGVLGAFAAQQLDRDAALDQHVLGEEHAAHAALIDRADHAVATLDDIAGLDA